MFLAINSFSRILTESKHRRGMNVKIRTENVVSSTLLALNVASGVPLRMSTVLQEDTLSLEMGRIIKHQWSISSTGLNCCSCVDFKKLWQFTPAEDLSEVFLNRGVLGKWDIVHHSFWIRLFLGLNVLPGIKHKSVLNTITL